MAKEEVDNKKKDNLPFTPDKKKDNPGKSLAKQGMNKRCQKMKPCFQALKSMRRNMANHHNKN
jgi:hypothetical protein